jgi:type I restriction enzyme R subunit
MTTKTNEQALEAAIEKVLTGKTIEVLKEAGTSIAEDRKGLYRGGKGYYMGSPDSYNAKYAIDEYHFWHFLETTQATELAKLQKHGDWKIKILDRLDNIIHKYCILRVFKKGLAVGEAHFTFFYELPLASSSDKVKAHFEQNEFSVTRQLRYSIDNPREEIDMVMFLNGLPFASMELKNAWTGQSARFQGQEQYRSDRDIKQPLLQFGRCIVHLAVDTQEVYMTTKLAGKSTFFLPFNKGNNHGKGNAPNPDGFATDYLWDEVLTRQSVANILSNFVRLDGSDKKPLAARTLFFPRYHQLDVVRRIVADTAEHGVGKTYLIQHSAGSGKSNSITWAAFQLIETYPQSADVKGSKGIEAPLFDSVIVVTDRRLLDKQLKENIRQFSEVANVVAHAGSSKQLRENLESGKKINITTIQKFKFIVEGISDLGDKNFAVIIDEAHSGQSGLSADSLNKAMGGSADAEDEDSQDKVEQAMKARKIRDNASYFAFTATPKNTTLERFGVKQADGSFKPFHLYSMKQAIEEGFIHDVLSNYSTYNSFYELEKSILENPFFDSSKAQKALKAKVERDRQTIAVKADIMLDHFISYVVNKKKLKGKAKAMVVTQSIESAINYYFELRKLLDERGNPFKIAVAFSGKKEIGGIEYTEEEINQLPAKLDTAKSTDAEYISDKIARYFDMPEYRILIVANKYLTGFDQPKLTAMYVDKKLQGVLAVQALSRLNRSANKLDKRTEDIFVLDFFNSVEDIKSAFDDFYTSTTLTEATDINVLHDIKDLLDESGVYLWQEAEAFTAAYFDNAEGKELEGLLAAPINRFNIELELTDKDKAEFKIQAKQFVKIYAQVASLMSFEVRDWEVLYWFLKYLIPLLKIEDPSASNIDSLLDSVDLSTYGLSRVKLNVSIGLDDSETELDPQNSNPRGAGQDSEEDPLDLILRSFNERYFDGWSATPEEQRVKFISWAKKMQEHPDFAEKYENNADKQNRDIAFNEIFKDVMNKNRRDEIDLYRMISSDDAFKRAMQDTLKRMLGR